MHYSTQSVGEDFHPRLIVWQLSPGSPEPDPNGNGKNEDLLTPNECHLVLEGIARTAKPIVVFMGAHLPQRADVLELVEYGIALGLKMIVEATPEDLTPDAIRAYSSFGPKIFRIIIDDAVNPGVDTRFDETPEFRRLDEKIQLLRSAGFEIHLSMAINEPDARRLAVQHDYAFRKSANGFYCHLAIGVGDSADGTDATSEDEIDRYIDAVANLKQFCPSNMYYLSPQCVKYGYRHIGDQPQEESEKDEYGVTREWRHWCLGGRSFAFITANGMVSVCSQLQTEDGDLRKADYDFKSIWETSETFRILRAGVYTCSQTRERLSALTEAKPQRRKS